MMGEILCSVPEGYVCDCDRCKHAREISTLQSRIAELEAQAKDWHDNQRTIMQEKCPTDEVHCTCVPTLRKALTEANEDAERFYQWSIAKGEDWNKLAEICDQHTARIQGKDGKG